MSKFGGDFLVTVLLNIATEAQEILCKHKESPSLLTHTHTVCVFIQNSDLEIAI